MGERLNFICVGNRTLTPREYRPCVDAVISHLAGLKAVLVEVMRVDGDTGVDTVVPWDSAEKIFSEPAGEGTLFATYFVLVGTNAVGRQSVTLDIDHGLTVVTVSLEPEVTGSEGTTIQAILTDLAGWATGTFKAAALACGPELDMYAVGEEKDMRRLEARLSSDCRCWLSMSTHRFSERMTAVK
jgi:hypothetical protein